jgi:acetyl esterase/lipase
MKILRCTGVAIAVLLLGSTAFAQPGPASLPDGTTVHRDLAYVADGHERQKLDLYLPRSETPTPVIVWVHGGAWLAGSKDRTPALRGLSEGYAVASINYRLSQHAIFPAQLEDCKAAVRWLRAHAGEYNLDPAHFAAWGASAGGHLVALLGTTGGVEKFDVGGHLEFSSRVQAVVDEFGPTDFLQMDDHRMAEGMRHNTPNAPEARLIGGPVQDNKEKVAAANPITYIDADDPPTLIVHGDKDPLVPHHQSELLEAALKEAGVPVTLYSVEGGGHGGFKDPRVPELIEGFFERQLKGRATAELPVQ